MSKRIKTKQNKKQPHEGITTQATLEYLQQLLSILQEVKTVFDPTSRNLCSLLSELFPSLTLSLTWVRGKDKKMFSYTKREGRDDRCMTWKGVNEKELGRRRK